MANGIDFNALIAKSKNAKAAPKAAADDRPKAQVWINLGYSVDVEAVDPATDQRVTETRFVSLPMGLPLDTMEPLSTNSSNEGFAAFQTARNELFQQLMEKAATLAPGEDCLINLQVNLRRVRDEKPTITSDVNPFSKKLTF